MKRRCLLITLATVTDWPERARQSRYLVSALAKSCNVSVGTLQDFFRRYYKINPKRLLKMWRQAEAERLLDAKERAMYVWGKLGYRDFAHFCNSFRRARGMSPTRWRFRRFFRT